MEALNPNDPYDAFSHDATRAIETVHFASEAIVDQVHAEHPDIEERVYQMDCLDALSRVRRDGESRALIHMATGLGKTTVAALDAKQFLKNNPDARILFVAHQKEILHQAKDRFEYILGDDRSYGMFTGESRKGKDKDTVFASFQLLHTSRDEFEPDDFDYIVVDEGHHGKATTYEPSLLYFEPEFILGMTATPDRRDLREIREIFGEEVYAKPLDKALSERLLARPDYRVILDDIAKEALLKPSRAIGDSLRQLNRKLFIPKRDEEIVTIIGEKAKEVENPKIIVFCPSIEHADRIAKLMPGAESLHSERTAKERRSTLDRFIHNGVPAITTVDIFNEGVDVADANVIVFLRSTQSDVIFQQQLGRGLRKLPGKESVLVLDFVASCDRLLMIDRTLGAHVEDDEADVILDDIDDSDDLYDLDFNVIRLRNEIDIERSDFTETTRQVLELLRSIDRQAGTLVKAPMGWVALRSLIGEQEPARESDRLGRCVRTLGVTAMRYIAEDERPSMHIAAEDVPRVMERYTELRQHAEHKIDWNDYSNEQLIELAKTLSPDERLVISQMKHLNKQNAFPSWSYIAKRFGTVIDFQRACGFDVSDKPVWRDWTDEEIIEYAKGLSPDMPLSTSLLSELSKEGIFMSAGPLASRFGTISEFQRRCGFEVKGVSEWHGVSEEDILTHARAEGGDEPFTVSRIQELSRDGSFPSMGIVHKYFGGVTGLNARLGHRELARTNWNKLADDEVIEAFLAIAPEAGLRGDEINTLSKEGKVPSRGYLERRFGSLREFYKLCGYKELPRERNDWKELDREGLIQLALEVSPDAPITEQRLNALTKEGLMPSKGIVKRLIGGLTDLQVATGFSPSIGTEVKLDRDNIISMAREISPDTVLLYANIRELYKEGRFPSLDVIRHRFGSIKAFQQAVWGEN